MIELRQIEQIIRVCGAGSVTEAAQTLGLTQPALSKSIAKLERQLGVKLFSRSGGTLQPTGYARLLVERGEPLLNSAAALDRDIKTQSFGGAGRMRMGLAPSARVFPLRAIPSEISKHMPDLHLEIRMEPGDSLLRGIVENRLDLIIVYHHSARPFGELMRAKLIETSIVTAVRPDHPILKFKKAAISSKILDYRIASTGLDPRWLARMSPQERANANAIHCDDLNIVSDCAIASDAIAIGPAYGLQPLIDKGDLVQIPNSFTDKFVAWLVGRPENWKSAVVRRVVKLAVDQCASARADAAAGA